VVIHGHVTTTLVKKSGTPSYFYSSEKFWYIEGYTSEKDWYTEGYTSEKDSYAELLLL
jgi:hypothetical protein